MTSRARRQAVALGLILLLGFPALGQAADATPPRGRILAPGDARVVVRQQEFACSAEAATPDTLLLTVGAESPGGGETHFHPLASLAFDRTLSGPDRQAGDDDTGQWMALWTFGPSAAGWRRTLRSALPLPVGAPRASASELERLDERLEEIRAEPDEADLAAPKPVVHRATLGRASRGHFLWGALRRGMSWADVFNPAQFVFRAHLLRRKDRRERNFQRSYLALQWLVDVEYTGAENAAWLDSVNELRFHLLRNRSFFGRWLSHADAEELVYNYESSVRVQLGKTSSWLQSAANEHGLRYQPVYRYTENGAGFPMGGVLYYDPQLGFEPDPGWWRVANPFDLSYNPHTDPRVQQAAREHPDELIPLAVYTFQTHLALRPIITIDFFAPGNPRARESTQQLMVLAKNWLAITTGSLSLERIPYRAVAWAANKKGFTFLVDKSSRLGVEELRVALESGLYFDSELQPLLLRRADQRVLNPLLKAGPVEERLAHIQYESLVARDAREVCRRLADVRKKMVERLKVPAGLDEAARRRELARRLQVWERQVELEDFVEQPLDDYGALAPLEEPLRYFLDAEPLDRKELAEVLEELYGKLYFQQLRMPVDSRVPELDALLDLTRQVWQRVSPAQSSDEFAQQVARREAKVRERDLQARREADKKRVEFLRTLLDASHQHLQRAARVGCGPAGDAPAELDAHLALLQEVAGAAANDPKLQKEFERRLPRLRKDLSRLEAALSQCPARPPEAWQAEWQLACLEQTRALRAALDRPAARTEASR